MTQRRKNRSAVEENTEDVQEAIKECVRYIICRESSKIPLKRSEIVKHLNNTCQTPSNQVNTVVIEANKVLKRVYGYKLIQVEAKSGLQYVVVLTEPCNSLPSTFTDSAHRRLLIAALTHIYMSSGPVKDDEMWKFLAEADVLDETDYLGRTILTTIFTKQMYLQYSKVGEGDFARYEFQWGQRAIEEIPKKFLLKKMAEAFDKNPNHWCEQYKEANEETRT